MRKYFSVSQSVLWKIDGVNKFDVYDEMKIISGNRNLAEDISSSVLA